VTLSRESTPSPHPTSGSAPHAGALRAAHPWAVGRSRRSGATSPPLRPGRPRAFAPPAIVWKRASAPRAPGASMGPRGRRALGPARGSRLRRASPMPLCRAPLRTSPAPCSSFCARGLSGPVHGAAIGSRPCRAVPEASVLPAILRCALRAPRKHQAPSPAPACHPVKRQSGINRGPCPIYSVCLLTGPRPAHGKEVLSATAKAPFPNADRRAREGLEKHMR